MSSPLEKFILENREKFDADTPDPRVWERISEKMNPESEKINPVRFLSFKRWLFAAAAVVLVGLAGVLYYSMPQNNQSGQVAGTNPKTITPDNNRPKHLTVDSQVKITKSDPTTGKKQNQNTQI